MRSRERLDHLGVGFIQQDLLKWNGRDEPRGAVHLGAKVFLAGSVPLCAMTGMCLDPHSDLDLYAAGDCFEKVSGDLKRNGFEMQYRTLGYHSAGSLKWRVARFRHP